MAASAEARAKSDSAPCFFVSQWKTWSALDDNTILLRMNNDAIYQVRRHRRGQPAEVRLAPSCCRRSHGNSVCSHLDLQLSAADSSIRSFRAPLIAKSLVKLTAEQVAAIPKKDLPGR